MNPALSSVEDYISSFPEEVQSKLRELRAVILKNAPEATEQIAYGMPGYKINKKPLVYFGGFPKHIGFYATPKGHEEFKEQLSKYKQGKGSVQFPLGEKLPFELIAEIVIFRRNENLNHGKN